jgi:PAS domain-containing protein
LLKIQNIEIQKKNEEIACQNQELTQQTQEIIVQRDLLKDTNNELGMINTFLQKVQNVQKDRDMVVIISDNNGKIEWVNNDFVKMYGFNKEEYSSKFHSILDRNENKVEIQRTLMNNQIYTCESDFKTKSEETITIKTMYIPIFDKNYSLFRIITIENELITDFPQNS